MSRRRPHGWRLVAPLVMLSLAAAGCSGKATGQRHVDIRSGERDCDFRGITTGAHREGVCTARGVAITVVDKAHWLRGKDYDARLVRIRTRGRVVTVTLSVRNTLAVAHVFDRRSDLVFLLVDGQYFHESPRLETEPSADPFRLRRAPVPPGESATGTVSFALPALPSAHLTAIGSSVVLVGYGDERKGFPTGNQPLDALGYIRLWK